MFAAQYFASHAFAPRFFAESGDNIAGGYFPTRYFNGGYFAHRYWGVEEEVVVTLTLVDRWSQVAFVDTSTDERTINAYFEGRFVNGKTESNYIDQ